MVARPAVSDWTSARWSMKVLATRRDSRADFSGFSVVTEMLRMKLLASRETPVTSRRFSIVCRKRSLVDAVVGLVRPRLSSDGSSDSPWPLNSGSDVRSALSTILAIMSLELMTAIWLSIKARVASVGRPFGVTSFCTTLMSRGSAKI